MPSVGLELYSAEEMTGTSKSCWLNAFRVSVSCVASGGSSLHWKLKTLGWLRRFCAIATAELVMMA